MIYDDSVQIDAELHDILTNWGRWARQRRWLSFCRSIESRYRPPAGEVWADEPRPIPPDAIEAWEVECAWRKLSLKQRLLLRAYFVTAPAHGSNGVWLRHVGRTCVQLGLARFAWGQAITQAAKALGNILTRPKNPVSFESYSNSLRPAERRVHEATSTGGFLLSEKS